MSLLTDSIDVMSLLYKDRQKIHQAGGDGPQFALSVWTSAENPSVVQLKVAVSVTFISDILHI